jgi:ribulose-phosphate 3-epimerase
MEIIPAILPKNFAELEEKISVIRGLSEMVQIDICDGKFVPTCTWPYWKKDENFEAILREERGMPGWEDIDYEFDLMIAGPTEDDARQWLSAGAKRVVLHYESSPDLMPVIAVLNGLVEIGIALDQKTPIDSPKLAEYSSKIQFIQLMGIHKPGFQGQQFMPETIERVRAIKATFLDLLVTVDGGVSLENALELKEAGADRLVVGSALFTSDNIVETFAEFQEI